MTPIEKLRVLEAQAKSPSFADPVTAHMELETHITDLISELLALWEAVQVYRSHVVEANSPLCAVLDALNARAREVMGEE